MMRPEASEVHRVGVATTDPVVVRVGARDLRLTNLDKVLYPGTGTTKAEVMAYVSAVGPALLRQLRARPVTRRRWPEGTGGPAFFEKNAPAGRPAWIPTVTIEHDGRGRAPHEVGYVLADEAATLVWFAQIGALELHTPQWRFDAGGAIRAPDRMVLDLDPGPGVGLAECAQVALRAREWLTDLGLDAAPVLSGSKGIHVYVDLPREFPVAPGTVAVAKLLADGLAATLPHLVVTRMARELRPGRVFVDWSQNDPAKTTVTPYSPRGGLTPTAASPVSWDEVERGLLRQHTFDEVVARLHRDGDLLAAVGMPEPSSGTVTGMPEPSSGTVTGMPEPSSGT